MFVRVTDAQVDGSTGAPDCLEVVPRWYRLMCPMCPLRPWTGTEGTHGTPLNASTVASCRLGVERSLVQIQSPRSGRRAAWQAVLKGSRFSRKGDARGTVSARSGKHGSRSRGDREARYLRRRPGDPGSTRRAPDGRSLRRSRRADRVRRAPALSVRLAGAAACSHTQRSCTRMRATRIMRRIDESWRCPGLETIGNESYRGIAQHERPGPPEQPRQQGQCAAFADAHRSLGPPLTRPAIQRRQE